MATCSHQIDVNFLFKQVLYIRSIQLVAPSEPTTKLPNVLIDIRRRGSSLNVPSQ